MGLFSAAIDNSPIDRFNTMQDATAVSGYGDEAFMRSKELWDPYSARNQAFQEQAMSDAYDMSSFQNMNTRRQAARTGQTSLGGFESSAKIRDMVRKNQMQLQMAQQGQATSLLGQAGSHKSAAGGMRNTLNSLYRQQQSANQNARMQSKQMIASMVGPELMGGLGAIAGPALGKLGDKIAGGIGGAASGAISDVASSNLSNAVSNAGTGFVNNAWNNITGSLNLSPIPTLNNINSSNNDSMNSALNINQNQLNTLTNDVDSNNTVNNLSASTNPHQPGSVAWNVWNQQNGIVTTFGGGNSSLYNQQSNNLW